MRSFALPSRSRLLGPVVSLVLLAGASLSFGAGSASAFAVAEEYGLRGKVSASGPMIRAIGDDRASAGILVSPLTLHAVDVDGLGASDQTINVMYELQRHDGNDWVAVDSVSMSADHVRPDTPATFGEQWFARPPLFRRVEYRVAVRAMWVDPPSKFPLGRAVVVPGAWNDATCETGDLVACEPTLTGGISF